MKFLKDIKEYKLQLITEASVVSKKNIDSYIQSYYDKYETFNEDIKKVVNKYIYKNIISNDLLKKYTINGVLDKEGFNKEIKELVDSTKPEEILRNVKKASKEIIEKSISEFIYNNILKILTIRKGKEGLMSEIDPITTIILAPFFIKFTFIDNIPKDQLQSFYDSLSELKNNPNYFKFLNFDKFKNISFNSVNEFYSFLIDKSKDKDGFVYFKDKSGNQLKCYLFDYIGKENKENNPSWWPFEGGPLKPAVLEYNLSNYINIILKDINEIDDSYFHELKEKITDKLIELEPFFKINKFVRLMAKFEVKNYEAADIGKSYDLKRLFYNITDKDIQEKTRMVSEINSKKGNSLKDKVISSMSIANRLSGVETILDKAEEELGSIIPTTPFTTLEEIDEINNKLGKDNGVEIIWESDDKLVVIVNSYDANFILNGEGTKYDRKVNQCIAWPKPNGAGYWDTYVGNDGPRLANFNDRGGKGEYKLQFYIYNFTKEARRTGRWAIGVTLGLSKVTNEGACQDCKNTYVPNLFDYLKSENIPFNEILDKVDTNNNGTKFEGMTFFEKKIEIKKRQIELNKKIKSGDLTIEEIEEALKEGANINAYDGVLIRKSINDFPKIKYLLSKGASIQYLFSELNIIIKNNNSELLKFLIQNGLDVSKFKISEDLINNFDVFKIVLDSWGDTKLTNDNISNELFNSITDIKVLYLLQSKGFDIKKALGVDVSVNERNTEFIDANEDNYQIIKYLLDNKVIKYNENNPFNIFSKNINVYHLFILNGYPINYQNSVNLYNFSKEYKNKPSLYKEQLENIIDLYLTENLIYKKSCNTCNGYGIVNLIPCVSCNETGLSNQLGKYKSFFEKKGEICEGPYLVNLFIDKYFKDKFIKLIYKLNDNNVDIEELLFDTLNVLKDPDTLEKLSEPEINDLIDKIKNLGIV